MNPTISLLNQVDTIHSGAGGKPANLIPEEHRSLDDAYMVTLSLRLVYSRSGCTTCDV